METLSGVTIGYLVHGTLVFIFNTLLFWFGFGPNGLLPRRYAAMAQDYVNKWLFDRKF